jgi:hypothetical protein
MQTEDFFNKDQKASYSSLIRELVGSVMDLMRSELTLIKEEAKITGKHLVSHTIQTAIFGALLALSVLPFLAFLVIGLGDLMNGRYWLSSLIVSILCAAIGGPMAYKSLQRIKREDLDLPHTRATIQREKEMIQRQVEHIHDSKRRRAV